MPAFHYARRSLQRSVVAGAIVAAIGIHSGPAGMLSAAHAASTESTVEAAKLNTVRPDMFKLVDPVRITELMNAKDYRQVQSRIDEAAALPGVSAYEGFVLNRLRIALGSASGNDAMAMTALEAVIASNRLAESDQQDFILALANYHYNANDHRQAIVWFTRYRNASNDHEAGARVRPYLIRAYYFSDDFARAKRELLAALDADHQAGRVPTVDNVRLLASSSVRTNDDPAYLLALETLVRFHPSDDAWTDLLNHWQAMAADARHLQLDVLRLQLLALTKMTESQYLNLAELTLQAGFPVEAKKVLDAGYVAGVLGTGADVAKHLALRDKANQRAQDEVNNIDAGAAAAAQASSGNGQVKLGHAYVTLGQFDKGIELILQGLTKGGLTRPEDGKLRLGIAYAMAGYKNEARQTLATLTTTPGDKGLGKLARYWTFYIDRPIATAADK
jgi:hypothetical protein